MHLMQRAVRCCFHWFLAASGGVMQAEGGLMQATCKPLILLGMEVHQGSTELTTPP